MTNLQRLTGKIFGETATATGDDPQIGQFGSALNGTYVGTTDVATIQSLPAWSNGFIDSVTPNEQFPPLPEMTGFGKVLSYQTAYTLQKGVPEWDPGTTYYTGDFCKGVGEGKLYVSKIDSNINNDLTDTNSWEEFSSGNGYEVGDIVIRNTPTNDAGKHLLDGALIQYGSYQAFVDYIADLYNTSTDKYSNVTKVGSVVDTDGVLSGLSASNYAKTPNTINFNSADSWEIITKHNITSVGSVNDGFMGILGGQFNVNYYINAANKATVELSSNGASYDIGSISMLNAIVLNTDFYLKLEFIGTAYNFYYSEDGENYTLQGTISSSAKVSSRNNYFALGVDERGSHTSWQGSIDLNGCYINIDGQRWWDGRQTAGFVTEDEWQQSVTTYGSCGKFVYDSTNNTIRLPKVSDILQGTTDLAALGDLIEAGLPQIPDHRHYYHYSERPDGTGWPEFGDQKYGPTQTEGISYIAPSNIYGKSDTVQPQAIKVLYYIVIATSTRTDIQVDIDEIATDLNGKADVDLTNINNTGTSTGAGWAMPSATYEDLTLGASGTAYTAPANGWYFLRKSKAAGDYNQKYLMFWVQCGDPLSVKYVVQVQSNAENDYSAIIAPVQKGDVCSVAYSFTGTTDYFRFIYAEGSESEAS